MNHTIRVEDMNCDHCRTTIDGALSRIVGVESVHIDLKEKRVEVTGDVDAGALQQAISKLGYTPRLLSSSADPSTPS